MINEVSNLGSLFLSALLASTLLPGGSELVLVMLVMQDRYDLSTLLIVASTGNTLGGMSTWGVGRFLDWCYPLSSFTKPHYRRAGEWLRQWGSPALLLSWLPVIGDSLCLAGGWLKVHWLAALLWIGVGKTLRYVVVLYLVS